MLLFNNISFLLCFLIFNLAFKHLLFLFLFNFFKLVLYILHLLVYILLLIF